MMDKEALLKARLPERELEIPGVGTVRVRGLSRAEVHELKTLKDLDRQEAAMLHHGLVDPLLTAEEVEQWRSASPAGELEPVVNAIAQLSGMLEGSAKEAYKSLSGDTGDGA